MAQKSILFALLIVFLNCSTKISAQSAPAAAPAKTPPIAPVKAPPLPPTQSPPAPVTQSPPSLAPAAQVATDSGPIDVGKILDKAGHFTVFARLLRSTQSDISLNKQLNNTNNGITILTPSDGAFGALKVGTLNSMNDEQKVELVKFHIIPQYIAGSQFQTQSNPLRTQAGTGGRVSLNVTTVGNIVNITTGLIDTTITGTVYDNSQLAIYQVGKVLLPIDIFTPKPLAPAPSPGGGKPKKASPDQEDNPTDSTGKADASGGISLFMDNTVAVLTVGIAAGMVWL